MPTKPVSNRLIDILEDKGADPKYREFWNNVFEKINKLCLRMKSAKGNYDIDDLEIRWCEDRVEYWLGEERILTKDEMKIANLYWKKYK